jgi:thiol-disulfide isomerase/thioredoxin
MEPMPDLYTGMRIINLTNSDFLIEKNKIYLSDNILGQSLSNFGYLQFYAPWCGHCRNFVNIYNDLADASIFNDKNIISVCAYNCTQPGSDMIMEALGIEGFPTLKSFSVITGGVKSGGGRKKYREIKMKDYDSGRSTKEMINYACKNGKVCNFRK